jgi:hypothetical protein
MASGNASLSHVLALTGSAPDQRRAATETSPPAAILADVADTVSGGTAPSVIVSASAIDLKVGDKLLGTIVGPDAKGNRYFVAQQGVFAVDPQSALQGLTGASLVITRTHRGIEAALLPPPGSAPLPPQPVKLQLVQANVAIAPDTFDAQALSATDSPVTLADSIALALRQISQQLPQGFALTPKAPPLLAAVTQPAAVQTEAAMDTPPLAIAGAETIDTAAPIAALPLAPALPKSLSLPVGTVVQLIPLAQSDTDMPVQNAQPQSLSLLADMPDDKTTRAAIWQSPLFGPLLKTGRLQLVATAATAQLPAQILATPALISADKTAVTVALEDGTGAPLSLPAQRLLILIDTAAAKIAPQLALPAEIEVQAELQALSQQRVLLPVQSISAPLPQLKESLPAELLLLFHAIGRKVPSPAAARVAQARYAASSPDGAALPALEVLRELARPSSISAAPAGDAPQRLVLPLQVEGQVLPLLLLYTPQEPQQDGNGQDSAAQGDAGAQSFALAIDFESMGPLVLRGRCGPRQLDLIVETKAPLPVALQESGSALFYEAMADADMAGKLRFVFGADEGWQSPSPTL